MDKESKIAELFLLQTPELKVARPGDGNSLAKSVTEKTKKIGMASALEGEKSAERDIKWDGKISGLAAMSYRQKYLRDRKSPLAGRGNNSVEIESFEARNLGKDKTKIPLEKIITDQCKRKNLVAKCGRQKYKLSDLEYHRSRQESEISPKQSLEFQRNE